MPHTTPPPAGQPSHDDWDWLPAAPFRAHVLHLLAGRPGQWRLVALAADVPPRTVRTLVGTPPSSLGRIRRRDAEHLYRLTADSLDEALTSVTSAAAARRSLAWLRRRGHSTTQVAGTIGESAALLEAIAAGQVLACPTGTILKLRAVQQAHRDARDARLTSLGQVTDHQPSPALVA